MLRILLTGGGTGGHIMPVLAVIEALPKDSKVLVLGSKLKDLPVPHKNILTGKLRRYWSWRNILDVFKLPFGLLQALWYVFWFMPDVCFGKGGYASVPGVIACWLYRIPIVIHESDTIPGIANRFLARLADKVCISYEEARKYFPRQKIVFTGNPVRKQIFQGARFFEKKRPTVLVLGGSQGAQKINDIMLQILPQLLKKADVIHQTGPGKRVDFEAPGYQQYEFIKNMGEAYARADVVISRAGANTLAEISVLKKPAILVPLPSASFNHQLKNAYAYAEKDGAIVIEENNLTPNLLLEKIFRLLDEPLRAKKMGENAALLNPLDASSKIAKEILAMVNN
jgi:UDP-N-acetylglucosamine--N-acetylmuramyl-(pentapeptide) pyrophosphoryl-undecaprenol N-acetylglucosamine transferase